MSYELFEPAQPFSPFNHSNFGYTREVMKKKSFFDGFYNSPKRFDFIEKNYTFNIEK